MNKHTFDAYDMEQLDKAKQILEKVYEYHYGDSLMRGQVKRLETIIKKIEHLQNT